MLNTTRITAAGTEGVRGSGREYIAGNDRSCGTGVRFNAGHKTWVQQANDVEVVRTRTKGAVDLYDLY